MASIIDIAREAGVSVATVSRVLNNERSVSPATAMSVEKAIKTLNYVPRMVRPGPKPKNRIGVHTGTIALLSVSDFSPEQMYALPAFPALLGGIQRGCVQHGMNLVLTHSPKGNVVPPVLLRKQADGVLLVGDAAVSASLKQALKAIPAVWCFRSQADSAGLFDHVFYDNSHIGEMAAQYLLECGHRQVAFAALGQNHPAFIERKLRFLAVATAGGARAVAVETTQNDRVEGSAKAAQLLADKLMALSPRPTGIFFSGDDLMLAVFNRMRQNGIEPQQDIELIGCNNESLFMGQMHPRPATIDIKLDLLGERAVEQLLWRMSHPADDSRMEILVKPVVVPADG